LLPDALKSVRSSGGAGHDLAAVPTRPTVPFVSLTMPKYRYDAEARERLIRWIRKRMDEFNISVDDLAAALSAPAYRDAAGHEWDGQGEMPTWLKAATSAGANPEFFRVAKPLTHTEEQQILSSAFFRRDAPFESSTD
jgi:DNA-binding protein H-NS